jgi:hypothetical protein
MAWGNPGYPQAGGVTIIPLPNGDVELFGPDGHSLGTLTPGGGGSTPTLADVLAVGADAGAVTITGLGAPANPNDAARLADVGGTADLAAVLGVGADAGGVTITGLGAPANPNDAARLADVGGGSASLGYVQSVGADNAGTPVVITLGTAPTSGNLLILVSSIDGADIASVVSAGTVWTQLADYLEAGQQSGSVYVGVVGPGASPTIIVSNNGGPGTYGVCEITGKTVSGVRAATHGAGMWTQFYPVLCDAQDGDIVVAVLTNRGNAVIGIAGGPVSAFNADSGGGAGMMVSLIP